MNWGATKGRKMIYTGLLFGSLFTTTLLFLYFFRFINSNIILFHDVFLPMIFFALFGFCFLMYMGMCLVSLNLHNYFIHEKIVSLAIWFNIFIFPLVQRFGLLLGFAEEQIKGSFIEVNNQIIVNSKRRYGVEDILLLAPHCIQNSKCQNKISLKPDNCKRCHGCQVENLLNLRDRYGIHLAIASGGSAARVFVDKYRPHVVIAVACEKDLVNGIRDTGALPVLGILNQRPFGPCHDTRAPLNQLTEALELLMSEQEIRLTEKLEGNL